MAKYSSGIQYRTPGARGRTREWIKAHLAICNPTDETIVIIPDLLEHSLQGNMHISETTETQK